jgi:hypothetical protein
VDSPDRLGKERRDGDHLDPRPKRLGLGLDCVGDEEALDRARLEPGGRSGREDGVGDGADD